MKRHTQMPFTNIWPCAAAKWSCVRRRQGCLPRRRQKYMPRRRWGMWRPSSSSPRTGPAVLLSRFLNFRPQKHAHTHAPAHADTREHASACTSISSRTAATVHHDTPSSKFCSEPESDLERARHGVGAERANERKPESTRETERARASESAKERAVERARA